MISVISEKERAVHFSRKYADYNNNFCYTRRFLSIFEMRNANTYVRNCTTNELLTTIQ